MKNILLTKLNKMVEDAAKNAAADKERRQRVELKNNAELLCYKLEQEVQKEEEKFSLGQKLEIENSIKEIRDLIAQENFDTDELSNKLNNLQNLVQNINAPN